MKKQELTPEQLDAVLLIASGKSNLTVAKHLNLTVRTIERWRLLPVFKNALKQALVDIYDSAIGELIQSAKSAVEQLVLIIEDEDTPKKTKVVAINSLLNQAAKYKSVLLEERLEQLETQIENTINVDNSED